MSAKPAKKKKPGEKLNNITPEYDSVREQTVLLEHMNQSIQTIAEQHSSIVEKLDQHSKDLSVIKSELDTVKMATMENSKDLSVIKSELDTVKMATMENSKDISVIKSELDTVKMATMENNHSIKALEVGQQELKAGQQRIEQKLDTVTSDHEQRITKLEERVLT